MSTTTLTTSASGYTVFLNHAYFHLRSSTATTGSAWEGTGEWWVRRDGSWFTFADGKTYVAGPLNFAWCGEDGDVVYGRFVDKDGNAGAFESYTFTCGSAYDYEQWVDASGGSDGNTGASSGSPVQTIAQAKTNMAANLGAGEEGVIWLKEAQDHNISATAWTGGSTFRRVSFRRWGTGSTRPRIVATVDTQIIVGGLSGGVLIDDIDLVGYSTPSDGVYMIDMSRSGAGSRNPFDLIIRNCDASSSWYFVFLTDDTTTYSNRTTNKCERIHLENVTSTDCEWYHIYTGYGGEKISLRNVEFGTANHNWATRCYMLGEVYWEDVTVNTGGDGVVLFATQDNDVLAASRYITVHRLHSQSSLVASRLTFGGNPGVNDYIGFVHDIYVSACRIVQGGCWVRVDAARVRIENGQFTYPVVLQLDTSSQAMADIVVRNNSFVRTSYAGSTTMLSILHNTPTIGSWTGCLTFTGNYGYWAATGSSEPRFGIESAFSAANTATIFALSDNNHLGKVDANSVNWGYMLGTTSLATWQGQSGSPDANSSQTLSTDFDLTDDGNPTYSTLDVHLTGTGGPLDDSGYALAYSVDAAGHLRSTTTPDAGPYEYGATTEPTAPSGGGGGGGGSSLATVYRADLSMGRMRFKL